MTLTSLTTPAGHAALDGSRRDVQDALYGPASRRLLREAGIGPDMRVLDLSSDGGSLARHLAMLVGPRGHVTAFARSEADAAGCAARLRAEGITNVSVGHGGIEPRDATMPFDAVAGRFVLRELRAPIETLHRLIPRLAPGGRVVFLEKVLAVPIRVFPPVPEVEKVVAWMDEARVRSSVQREIGVRLPELLERAGLPAPEVRCESPVDCGPAWPACDYLAEQLRVMEPLMEHFAIATPSQLALETLPARLRAACARSPGTVILLAPMIAAWSRVP
ncbi:MAG: methyltransferase domain-containing protein [Gemmatimonadaceae bacterium]|nr:methyltransferase domain-containing protein [Gemmatimonadaceae bacterium]